MDLVKDRVRAAWRSSEAGASWGMSLKVLGAVGIAAAAAANHHRSMAVPSTARAYASVYEEEQQTAAKAAVKQRKSTKRSKKSKSSKGDGYALRTSIDDMYGTDVEASLPSTSPAKRSLKVLRGDESVLESDMEGSGLVQGILHTPKRAPARRLAPVTPAAGVAQGLVVTPAAAPPKDKRIAVNGLFLRRLSVILRVCIPSLASREALLLAIYSALLVSRTFFTMAISELSGFNAEMLVRRNWRGLWRGIGRFAIVTIPAACVNSGIKYVQQLLALRFRQRLSMYVNAQYIRGVNFYKACQLGKEARIDGADQRVTSDIEKFSTAVSEVYSTMFKPVLDIAMFTHRLRTLLGWQGPAMMYSYFGLTFLVKKKLMPAMGRLIATESQLEGQYRNAHQRLIEYSEEITFYEGFRTERAIINQLFRRLIRHTDYVVYLRGWINFADGLLIKYWATIVGYAVMASPMIFGLQDKLAGKDSGALTADYIRNTSYLMGLSAAIGQLVLVENKILNVAGFTARVSELLEMVTKLETAGTRPFEVREEHVKRSGDESERELENSDTHTNRPLPIAWLQQWQARREHQKKLVRDAARHRFGEAAFVQERRISNGGCVRVGESIIFDNVDLVSPDGQLLCQKLSFQIPPGESVIITGPNGSGKSSLGRLLAELWPVQSGCLTKPTLNNLDVPFSEVMFVPQKPYMVLGTLRDQLTYPHTRAQAQASDEDLERLLTVVDPNRIITSQWGFDTIDDYSNKFSGGQRQRVSMARLFYHKPRYAVLDECTNAMSEEIEDKMYEAAHALGITCVTVSHRESLKRHHVWQLNLTGDGKWTFERLDHASAASKDRR